jgi:hypothetical protein
MTAPPFGGYSCPTTEMTPLKGKSQRDAMKSYIQDLQASGWTAGHIGTAWGWYALSEKWDSVFTGPSKPEKNDPKKVAKNVLVMTDGLFNTSYKSGTALPSPDQANESYAQFQALCANMKSDKVTVFTVGLELNDPRALSELQTCATSTATFFDVKSGGNLRQAFKKIAEHITALRIEK